MLPYAHPPPHVAALHSLLVTPAFHLPLAELGIAAHDTVYSHLHSAGFDATFRLITRSVSMDLGASPRPPLVLSFMRPRPQHSSLPRSTLGAFGRRQVPCSFVWHMVDHQLVARADPGSWF